MSTHATPPHHDVVVVGARAAGASTAMLLARRGHRVLVLDRTAHGSDTLSTHALMRAGVLQLARWGLLDRIVAAGTPPIPRVTFRYGPQDLPIELSEPLYAPRRTVLDTVLVDAAVEAGAEVRRGVQVQGLLADAEGRVRGVRARDADGHELEVRATLTIGADGMRSRVAREVAAPVTHAGRAAAAFVYTYVAGVETDGIEWLYGPEVSAGLIPTNDGQTCVFVGVPSDRFARELRFDLAATLTDGLRIASPDAARRVAAGRRVAPIRGFPGVPGWLRRPYGDGWALVGDAGYFKDPATAHGITDALRDAELLARAADEGLEGRQPMTRALAGYARTRDELSLALMEATEPVAAFTWTLQDLPPLHLAMTAAMRAEVRYLQALDVPVAGVLAGTAAGTAAA